MLVSHNLRSWPNRATCLELATGKAGKFLAMLLSAYKSPKKDFATLSTQKLQRIQIHRMIFAIFISVKIVLLLFYKTVTWILHLSKTNMATSSLGGIMLLERQQGWRFSLNRRKKNTFQMIRGHLDTV